MYIISKTLVKKDFKEIGWRQIKTVEDYERLRREVEGKAYVDGKLNALQLLQLKVDLDNERYDLEKLKEQSLTINLPAVIMILSVILGVIGSKCIDAGILIGISGKALFIAIMMLFLVLTVIRAKHISDIRNGNLLFYDNISKILDRAVAFENEKI